MHCLGNIWRSILESPIHVKHCLLNLHGLWENNTSRVYVWWKRFTQVDATTITLYYYRARHGNWSLKSQHISLRENTHIYIYIDTHITPMHVHIHIYAFVSFSVMIFSQKLVCTQTQIPINFAPLHIYLEKHGSLSTNKVK